LGQAGNRNRGGSEYKVRGQVKSRSGGGGGGKFARFLLKAMNLTIVKRGWSGKSLEGVRRRDNSPQKVKGKKPSKGGWTLRGGGNSEIKKGSSELCWGRRGGVIGTEDPGQKRSGIRTIKEGGGLRCKKKTSRYNGKKNH